MKNVLDTLVKKGFPSYIDRDTICKEVDNICKDLSSCFEQNETRVFYITEKYLSPAELDFISEILLQELDMIDFIELFDYEHPNTKELRNLFIIELYNAEKLIYNDDIDITDLLEEVEND